MRNSFARSSEVFLFDREPVKNTCDRLDDNAYSDFGSDSGEQRRLQLMKRLCQCRRHIKSKLFGSVAMAQRVLAIETEMPNFHDVVAIVAGAIAASTRSGKALRLPHMLLHGAPGVGKSHFTRLLAEALQTPSKTIQLNLLDDIGQITGHSASWRSARCGAVAQTLIDSNTISPIIIGDEIDKMPQYSKDERPIDAFHSLLETENSTRFVDQFLDFPIRADHVFWILTANDVSLLPSSIVDRLLVLDIQPLTEAQMREFVRRQVDAAIESFGGAFVVDLDDRSAEILVRHDTRTMLRIIDAAVGAAALDCRAHVEAEDFVRAERICGDVERKSRMGFLRE